MTYRSNTDSEKDPFSNTSSIPSNDQNAWSTNAGQLAKFVVANLINRDDAYGLDGPKGQDGAE